MIFSRRGDFLFFFLREIAQNQSDQLDRFAFTYMNDCKYKVKINSDNGLIKVKRTKNKQVN